MNINQPQETALNSYPIPADLGVNRHIAKWISQIGSPPITTILSSILVAIKLGTPMSWLWAIYSILISVVLPTSYVAWLVYKGEITDLHMKIREQRKKPLIVTSIGAFVVLATMFFGDAPSLFLLIATANLVQTIIFFVITLHWKISFHCLAASSLMVLSAALIPRIAIFFVVSLPVIAWARLILKRHTPAQVLAGSALGSLITITILYGGC